MLLTIIMINDLKYTIVLLCEICTFQLCVVCLFWLDILFMHFSFLELSVFVFFFLTLPIESSHFIIKHSM